jgi:hypothetical protein
MRTDKGSLFDLQAKLLASEAAAPGGKVKPVARKAWLPTVQRMLDLVPTNIHERCPVILGSPRDVNLILGMYKGTDVQERRAVPGMETARERRGLAPH